ncbi:MAG: 50S ribosomal protein L30e [Candidatus Micrarchaeia archaeon]
MEIQKSIRMAVDTGKVMLGKNESIRSITSGKCKLVIFSANAPNDIKVSIRKAAEAGDIPWIEYEGNAKELGVVCGKPYPINVISIIEPGDSDILSTAKQ